MNKFFIGLLLISFLVINTKAENDLTDLKNQLQRLNDLLVAEQARFALAGIEVDDTKLAYANAQNMSDMMVKFESQEAEYQDQGGAFKLVTSDKDFDRKGCEGKYEQAGIIMNVPYYVNKPAKKFIALSSFTNNFIGSYVRHLKYGIYNLSDFDKVKAGENDTEKAIFVSSYAVQIVDQVPKFSDFFTLDQLRWHQNVRVITRSTEVPINFVRVDGIVKSLNNDNLLLTTKEGIYFTKFDDKKKCGGAYKKIDGKINGAYVYENNIETRFMAFQDHQWAIGDSKDQNPLLKAGKGKFETLEESNWVDPLDIDRIWQKNPFNIPWNHYESKKDFEFKYFKEGDKNPLELALRNYEEKMAIAKSSEKFMNEYKKQIGIVEQKIAGQKKMRRLQVPNYGYRA